MAAVICSRRPIDAAEYLPVLLGTPADRDEPDAESGSFASETQRERFLTLWNQRWNEAVTALDAEVSSLEDALCYCPEVMDIRGAVARMPAEEQAAFKGEDTCPRLFRCGRWGRELRRCARRRRPDVTTCAHAAVARSTRSATVQVNCPSLDEAWTPSWISCFRRMWL